MSENYFYSSLSGQEIEDTLVGAVVYNKQLSLTTSQKAQARANIGAGEVSTGLIIKGYYDTAADLESAHPMASEGDAYMVGTEAPYDVYIWDAVNSEWVNNGVLTPGDSTIDDNDISFTHTWSSQKINTELSGKATPADVAAIIDDTDTAADTTWSSDKISTELSGKAAPAASFTVTLLSASWSSNAQTVSDSRFVASGYAYIVTPASTSFSDYADAVIYADDVTANGAMTFHCGTAPSSDLTANIVRVVSA